MKKRWMRWFVIVICMLAAGICYSCSRGQKLEMNGGSEARILEFTEESSGEKIPMPETIAAETHEKEESYRYVHICGEVMSPGVYRMESESRVFQVVDKAGGFTDKAASEYLNLAEVVQDGMKLVVPSVDEWKKAEQYGQSGWSEEVHNNVEMASKINLNTATKEQLMTLKGVGEAKAEDIIRYREERGFFQTIEDIMKIPGIKDAAFQKIRDNITV